MADTVADKAKARRFFDDEVAETRLAKAREKIRKNFPDGRAALHWRHDSPNRLVSTCARFSIDKHGEGDATRYTARLQPNTIIGHRRFTVEQAKEDCCRHASPLPLEPPPAQPELPTIDREPGSDDE